MLPPRWPIISLKIRIKSTVKCTSSAALCNMDLVYWKIQDQQLQLMKIGFGLRYVLQNGSVCLKWLPLVVHFQKKSNWYKIWLPFQHTSTTHSAFNGLRIRNSTKICLLGIPLVRSRHMCQVFPSLWHSLFYFTGN